MNGCSKEWEFFGYVSFSYCKYNLFFEIIQVSRSAGVYTKGDTSHAADNT